VSGGLEAAGRLAGRLHHATAGLLRDSYHALKRQAAPGVDGVTWQPYGEGLEERLQNRREWLRHASESLRYFWRISLPSRQVNTASAVASSGGETGVI